jgi:hypothetical protein
MKTFFTLLAMALGLYFFEQFPVLSAFLLIVSTAMITLVLAPVWVCPHKPRDYVHGELALGPVWALRAGDARSGIVMRITLFYVVLAHIDYPERRYRCLARSLRVSTFEERDMLKPVLDIARKTLKL